MTLQEKIERIKYICSLDDSMIRGDTPKSWIFSNLIVIDSGKLPQYISLTTKEQGYEWRPAMYHYTDIDGYAVYHNNTIGCHYLKDGVCSNGGVEFNYKEISRDEYISYYLDIAEQYVKRYDMKEKTAEDSLKEIVSELNEIPY